MIGQVRYLSSSLPASSHGVTAVPDTPVVGRRRFLIAGAGAAIAVGADPAHAEPLQPTGFALIGDTQIDVSVPARTEWLRWVYADMAAAGPEVVCHVGDIVEYGSAEEYEAYLSTIPDGLRPIIRHVPGNHETRWDGSAGERYEALFGRNPYSFDACGIHFVGLAPVHLLQEPGAFGPAGLDWLERDLDGVDRETPIILLVHFPLGGPNNYVSDGDRLLRAIESRNVRAILAGHVHVEEVEWLNGIAQVTVDDTRGRPVYYWATRTDGDKPTLVITAVERAADGTVGRRPVVSIPLSGPRPGAGQRPERVLLQHDEAGGAEQIAVRLPADTGATAAWARIHPQHSYGRRDATGWQPLTVEARGRRFTGRLDLSGLAPGGHRVTVRIDGADGRHERTEAITVPGAEGRVLWRERLGQALQSGLAAHGRQVIIANTAGDVIAAEPGPDGLRQHWRTKVGSVYGRPVFDASGSTVYVPSADHRLYALDAATGRARFNYDAGAPIVGSPLITELAGRTMIIIAAGATRQLIDARSGARVWSVEGHGIFAGRAASDGRRVYAGSGTGHAYAFDAADGAELWRFDAAPTRTGPYLRLIYGPWYDSVQLLEDGSVLVGTVSAVFALDAATGLQRWTRPGSFGLTPRLHYDGDLVLIDDFARTVTRIDPTGSSVRWTATTGVRAMNTGAAVQDGVAWIPGTTGQLTAVDLDNGSVLHRIELTDAYCYGPPVMVDGVLLVGDQDGTLHAVDARR